jgi:hypothetical protein
LDIRAFTLFNHFNLFSVYLVFWLNVKWNVRRHAAANTKQQPTPADMLQEAMVIDG